MARPRETCAKPILEAQGIAEHHWVCATASAWERCQLPSSPFPGGDLMWRVAGCQVWIHGIRRWQNQHYMSPWPCLPPIPHPCAGGGAEDLEHSRNRQWQGSDNWHLQLLWVLLSFPMDPLSPQLLRPHGPSIPEDPADSPRCLRQEAATRNTVHRNDFSQSCVLFPQLSAVGRKEILNSRYKENRY